jgi:hypothetical protein
MSPKLNKDQAESVNEAEAASGGDFDPVPNGMYVCQLTGVEVKMPKPKKDASTGKNVDGDPYWAWEFTIPDGHPYAKRKFWNNTSTGEASKGFMKATFDAFGVSADTDTDTLIGEYVVLSIGTRIIKGGSRDGQPGNTVREVLAYSEDADEASDESGPAGEDA